MWSLLRLSALSLSALVLVGCSDPKVDTSSMPAAVVSIEKVRESLPTYKRDEFDTALKIIAMSSFNGIDLFNPQRMNAAEIAESANAYMHGLTGDEIIERADKMLRQRRAREREQALRTLNRLEAKQDSAQRAQEHLAQISIDNARYYISTSPYGALEPVIELTVTNGSDRAVAELMLHGVLKSPNREVAWVDETFYYAISGGLAPGESATWSLAPNRFGPWGNDQIPRNAVLTLTLLGVNNSEGEPLWDAPALTDNEAERLEELRAEYGGVNPQRAAN
ncbi:DUF6694 family lipoprotein [Vreelandella aquamarina]|uniref:Lipoprotein n=1 Tax=Vreelandella aquamarina TaxID=77097 RepID=A0A1N6CQY2_9GAMM|nr:DUF6694 family lipoprotein [Halomonas meridiana]SIN60932.1 hypothetical protein SAMN05878249_0415 [Halomonas meridiana]SIN65805.1 hypothetical protein SAMN05878438_1844 [Halomonas meridiana]SIO01794.1 hypothetical protein SAMN05878442_0544 [Halomonas meridiana]